MGLNKMLHKGRRSILTVAIIVFVSVLWLASPTSGQIPPNGTALSAFGALRTAESAGANITSLVNQYNNLLQQSAPNSSFANLGQLAQSAQQDALAVKSLDRTLTLVLVPVIALALALTSEALLQLRRKIDREKMLEMEIHQK